MNIGTHHSPDGQHGSALIISLLILIVLTLLGLAAMSTNTLEEKMAGNLRTKDVTFQAAESGLRAGEDRFKTGGTWFTTIPAIGGSGANQIWDRDATGVTAANPQPASWWASNSIAVTGSFGTPNPDPSYLIEEYGFVPDTLNPDDLARRVGVFSFRISAHGIVGNTASVLQSVYAKRYR